MRIQRALVLSEPPSVERGEITDKGYINQRFVLEGRSSEVKRLYASPSEPEIVFG
jgi:feruloyl-CoA synthase